MPKTIPFPTPERLARALESEYKISNRSPLWTFSTKAAGLVPVLGELVSLSSATRTEDPKARQKRVMSLIFSSPQNAAAVLRQTKNPRLKQWLANRIAGRWKVQRGPVKLQRSAKRPARRLELQRRVA
ncbi:MAG: hypothetical protein V1777_00620 [Candidatus Micrarchaeota archaeon]